MSSTNFSSSTGFTSGGRARPSMRRVLVLLGAAVILLAGLRIGLTLVYMRTQALDAGERLTESFAHVIAEETARTFQAIDQRLQLTESRLSQLRGGGKVKEAALSQLLRSEIADQPFIHALSVLDAHGTVLDSSVPGSAGVSLADRAYFQIYRTAPNAAFYVGAPVRSRTTGNWLISATRPLRSGLRGDFAGLIVAAVEPSYFDRLWSNVELGDGGSIVLFHRDGTLMMRSPFDEGSMGKNFGQLPVFAEQLPKRPAGTFQNVSAIDGITRLFAYQTLPNQPDLLVVVGKSRDLVLAPWKEFAFLGLATWAGGSIALVILGLLLNRTWLERLKSEARTERMAQRLTLATDAANIGVWDWDLATDAWYATPAYFTMLGYEPDDGPLQREVWMKRVHPEDREGVEAKISEALGAKEALYQYVARVLHADGNYRWVAVIGRVLARDSRGKAIRLLGARIDVTESKLAEQALRGSVREKEALLQEVHHRVKNNLQVIASLLRLEAGRSAETSTRVVLNDMQSRIRAMALLHETLYRSSNFAAINLGDYLHRLATQFFRAHNNDPNSVGLALNLSPTHVGIDQAIPCGLIVNELLTNSLKHGFPNGRIGEVKVSLSQDADRRILLEISDTGVGLPADFDAKKEASLGLHLVNDLARQLGGRLDIGPLPAAIFTVTFGAPLRTHTGPIARPTDVNSGV